MQLVDPRGSMLWMCLCQQFVACIASLVQPVYVHLPICFLHRMDGCCAEHTTGACVRAAAGATSLGNPPLHESVPAPQPHLSSAEPAA